MSWNSFYSCYDYEVVKIARAPPHFLLQRCPCLECVPFRSLALPVSLWSISGVLWRMSYASVLVAFDVMSEYLNLLTCFEYLRRTLEMQYGRFLLKKSTGTEQCCCILWTVST